MVGPDSDLQRAPALQVEIFHDHRLRRALWCDVDHQHPRAPHVSQRFLARMQKLLGGGLAKGIARRGGSLCRGGVELGIAQRDRERQVTRS